MARWVRSAPGSPLGFHVFARADGRALAHNIFLDGNTFGDSPSVGHNVFVADLSTGFVLNWHNTKMSYAVVYRTREFNAQIAPQLFGTVSLNVTF